MKEIKETAYKGTRILLGNEKRISITLATNYLVENGFTEIAIPVIQLSETFIGKVGEENNNLMFNFTDRGNRNICLAPEYTAVIQKLSQTYFKRQKNVCLFYVQECFRGEKPQSGRYRQFTQLGVEILNPNKDYTEQLIIIASYLLKHFFYLGKLKIATFFYDGSISKGDIKKYKVTSPVRGIEDYLGHFETEEEAVSMCCRVATTFLNMLSHGI